MRDIHRQRRVRNPLTASLWEKLVYQATLSRVLRDQAVAAGTTLSRAERRAMQRAILRERITADDRLAVRKA